MSSPPEEKSSQTTEHGTFLGGPPASKSMELLEFLLQSMELLKEAFTFFFTWFLD